MTESNANTKGLYQSLLALAVAAAIIVGAVVWAHYADERIKEAQRISTGSPIMTYPLCLGPGTCHAFGYGIEYTVRGHASWDDGVAYAIVSSGHTNEEHVEIWSPLSFIVKLSVGTRFKFENRGTWHNSFRVTHSPKGSEEKKKAVVPGL